MLNKILTATFNSTMMICAFSIAQMSPTYATTPDNNVKLDNLSQTACIKSSGLISATASSPIRFSDKLLVEARVIEGVWPQAHMNGAQARMLCLYNRKTKQVEVQEWPTQPKPAPTLKDVWWQAEDIDGKGIIDRSELTFMLGSDGKIGGKSGCNGYSASYQITEGKLKVTSPLISTRMLCAPAIMTQEQNFHKMVETIVSFTISAEGALILQSADGTTSHFVRK
ncbi:META domain-containing protein [Sphingorhabdus contaminans]|uniref:META domain-containing protein n=1 Tax=Sphingorhabdus contaminans TaxID=1343899 RepID=A0A553WCK0_9SPHN|nr:META domain-containing protein [Sphingorhabdus contaminans]TSB02414.1 META domain-containing protein [Sphingorhabdus contaminans]